MRIGISYDLKDAIVRHADDAVDALEEYDSVETIETIKKSLEDAGHEVVKLGGGTEFYAAVTAQHVDLVFNIAEGRGSYRSREAQVPAILEMLGIPYSGSDPQTLAVCLDKPLTKKLVSLDGVMTPAWRLIRNREALKDISWDEIRFPAIVKPAFEGSSKGIHGTSLVHGHQEAYLEIDSQLATYHQPVLVEEFIDGDEVTVGMIGNDPPEIVGIMRVLPREKPKYFVYSVEVKRDWERLVEYECPAALSKKTTDLIREYSLKAFDTLGCRDFSRVDFRVNKDGIPYFIEINPLPGLGSYSDLIIMAKKLGWSHEGVIQAVCRTAVERYPQLRCV